MKMRYLSFAIGLTLLAQTGSRSGIDTTSLDRACKPCDDFWRFANGGWLDKNPIPSHRPAWGTMSLIAEGNRERIRAILEAAALAKAAPNSNEAKIGDFYGSCMDTKAIDARGVAPLKPLLDRVERIGSRADLAAVVAEFAASHEIGPFSLDALPDFKDSTKMMANVGSGGLTLPDRDYYFKTDTRSQSTRDEMVKHVTRMLELIGDPPDAAAAGARTILAFETKLADATYTNVQQRDPEANYHKTSKAALAALTPAFDWKPVWKAVNLAEPAFVNVQEPKFVERFQQLMAEAPLADWKPWLRWRLLDHTADYLSKPVVDQDFHFRSTVLFGTKEQNPRWQKCAIAADQKLGEALGEVYVRKHFPAEARERMRALVENLRVTLREELDRAAWLEPATRKNALAKLNAFVAKIGYPDKWRDYRALAIERARYFENAMASTLFTRRWALSRIDKPVDRSEWHMTPPTVNAYYSPLQNEIVFPAGILQPPMFDMEADDAVNYGGIGAVIGHEMGHGFDDQGSKFDARGNLQNWWTGGDRAKFDERAACVVEQFNTIDAGDGLRHTGKLVVGEALGDLGGATLAYRAYRRSLKGRPEPPVVDGFTADQRFFLAFARVWSTHYRPETARLRINTDPHPLPKWRTNATLQNMPEFHKAFQCKSGDFMVRAAERQCKLW